MYKRQEEAPENVMTDNGDGTYTKVFTNVQIADSLQIKVVEKDVYKRQSLSIRM